MPDYSVIIPTHNEGVQLILTVQSVIDTFMGGTDEPRQLEIIVVDDQSTDGSLEALALALKASQPSSPRVSIHRGEERLGCSGAKRLGATKAEGDMLIFLDAHNRCGQDWLRHLEDGIARAGSADVGMFGPVMHSLTGDSSEMGEYWPTPEMKRSHMPHPTTDSPAPVLYICGNGQAISRAVYDEVGGFDEGLLPPWGSEDEELCLRLWRYGYQCVILPNWEMSSLYRSQFPYKVEYGVVLYNKLRLAWQHFDQPRIGSVLHHSLSQLERDTSGDDFSGYSMADKGKYLTDAINLVCNEELFEVRRHHQEREKRTIDEIFKMFGMEW